MSTIKDRLTELRNALPEGVRLVAVSKTHPASAIMEAWDAGQRVFGESRPQEMAAKHAQLPGDIEWHLIGHLQRNKVRTIIPFVAMIHSVDSARLLETIQAEAARADRTVDVLLEVHVADEDTKSGWEEDELTLYLRGGQWRDMHNVRLRGVMGIATNTTDTVRVKADFDRLREIFQALRREFFSPEFDTLSMGMTSDWRLAVQCGSNTVRVGSLIFGHR